MEAVLLVNEKHMSTREVAKRLGIVINLISYFHFNGFESLHNIFYRLTVDNESWTPA